MNPIAAMIFLYFLYLVMRIIFRLAWLLVKETLELSRILISLCGLFLSELWMVSLELLCALTDALREVCRVCTRENLVCVLSIMGYPSPNARQWLAEQLRRSATCFGLLVPGRSWKRTTRIDHNLRLGSGMNYKNKTFKWLMGGYGS